MIVLQGRVLSRVWWRTGAAGSRSERTLSPRLAPGTPKESAQLPGRCRCPLPAPGQDLRRDHPRQQGRMVLCGILEGLERHVVLPVVTLIFPWDRGLPNGQELLIPRSGPLSSQDLRDIAEPRPGNGLGCWVARDPSSGITRELRASPFPPGWGTPLPSIPELPLPSLCLPWRV